MEQDILDSYIGIVKQMNQIIFLLHSESWCIKNRKSLLCLVLDENSRKHGIKTSEVMDILKGYCIFSKKFTRFIEESETFWCIIGFAKSLPYFFEVKDVMKGVIA